MALVTCTSSESGRARRRASGSKPATASAPSPGAPPEKCVGVRGSEPQEHDTPETAGVTTHVDREERALARAADARSGAPLRSSSVMCDVECPRGAGPVLALRGERPRRARTRRTRALQRRGRWGASARLQSREGHHPANHEPADHDGHAEPQEDAALQRGPAVTQDRARTSGVAKSVALHASSRHMT